MVIPIAKALTTTCLLGSMNAARRDPIKQRYRILKKYGIRAGVSKIAKEVTKRIVRKSVEYSYLCFSGIPLLTNAPKVVKVAKTVHSCAFAHQ